MCLNLYTHIQFTPHTHTYKKEREKRKREEKEERWIIGNTKRERKRAWRAQPRLKKATIEA